MTFRLTLILIALLSCGRCVVEAIAQESPARSDDNLSKRVDQVIERQMHDRRIPGLSLAIVRDGKVIKAQGYGLANVEHAAPATPETAYLLASMTKQFTAAGILMLADEGKLSIDDPIGKYLADPPDAWKEITIRQLLGHTAGLKDRFEEDTLNGAKWRMAYSTAELYQAARQRALDFSPGTVWQYSDQGYFLLGMIIERASGQSYRDFLKKRIFAPLGMDASTTIMLAEITPHLANGYSIQGGSWVHNRRDMDFGMTSHFGIVSTVLDLARWDTALREQRLLKPADYRLWWTPVSLNDGSRAFGPLGSYGFGWFLDKFRGHRMIYHGGATGTAILRLPDDGLTVIVLTNLEQLAGGDADTIARRIAAIYVPGIRWLELKQSADPDPKLTARLKQELSNLAEGNPDLSFYSPSLANGLRENQQATQAFYSQLGVLQEFTFCETEMDGPDRSSYYKVKYGAIPMPVYVRYTFNDKGQIAFTLSSM